MIEAGKPTSARAVYGAFCGAPPKDYSGFDSHTVHMTSARGTSKAWKRIAAAQRARLLPCYLCGQPIDYTLQHPHPHSFSADHLKPYVSHPELRLDPANVVSAHLRCNQSKGSNMHYSAGLGAQSEVF